MAPPSYGPPGYSIPQRFMNRKPPPEGADTNTRPYVIFFSYMLTCFSVAVYIIVKITQKHAVLKKSTVNQLPPRKHLWLFASLAAGSLLTTWTYMVKYFNLSYRTWLMWRSYYELDPSHRHWGLWLKETSLFKEAWEIVVVGNARYWWSHQIFFFALGLGLYMEQKGIRRGIGYTWAFMLLGQIVAISFATNLFLLTLLLSPSVTPPSASTPVYQRGWLSPWILNLLSIFATAIPAFLLASEHYWHHSSDFLPMLLVPHIALMVLPCARAFIPSKCFADGNTVFNKKAYNYMWALTLGNAILMLLKTSWTAYTYNGFHGIRTALLEHPAVSSVGFDVVFCWITWFCWLQTQNAQAASVPKESISRLNDTFEDDGAGIAIKSNTFHSSVRRR